MSEKMMFLIIVVVVVIAGFLAYTQTGLLL